MLAFETLDSHNGGRGEDLEWLIQLPYTDIQSAFPWDTLPNFATVKKAWSYCCLVCLAWKISNVLLQNKNCGESGHITTESECTSAPGSHKDALFPSFSVTVAVRCQTLPFFGTNQVNVMLSPQAGVMSSALLLESWSYWKRCSCWGGLQGALQRGLQGEPLVMWISMATTCQCLLNRFSMWKLCTNMCTNDPMKLQKA